jgi:uncharacterized membrane protein YphA (DoxX/SURF4 family)
MKLSRKAPAIARVFLGALFLLFGLNGFLHFLPMPPAPEKAGAFLGALAATGYMFPLIKGTEVVAGLLLLSGRFVPLALTLLAPVVVNIVAYHAVLAPEGVAFPIVLAAVGLYLAYAYRGAFKGVLDSNAKPVTTGAIEVVGRTVDASAE